MSRGWALAAPIALGVLACLVVTGGSMLWPGNVRWLAQGDLAQSYLGWAFYRQAPWSLPLGANPGYGIGLHGSIYYSDSIPLLAMLFKPLAPWLPEPFQYFGLWVLACFVLQACFAWRLLGLVTPRWPDKLLGAFFFVLAPPMLMRLGGHMALVGHWMLLASIYLCLRPSRRHQAHCWAVLVAGAMIVHAYLFVMVAAVWLADVIHRYRLARATASAGSGIGIGIGRRVAELAMVGAAAGLAAWLAGFFMVSGHGMQAEGFGYYKMNLLAPIAGNGWSWFGLDTSQGKGEYEGFNYLGLGGIALVLAALLLAALARRGPRLPRLLPGPLLLAAVGLTLLALTCNIGVGGWQWHMPLPQRLWAKLSHLSLQSTGRLFWVPYYLLLLASLFTVLRRLHGRWLTSALVLLAVLQLIDLSAGLSRTRGMLLERSHAQDVPGLHGAFWDAAGERYHQLRQVPLALASPGWEPLAFYAQAHRMRTDAIQLARFDWNRFLSLYNDQQAAVSGNRLDAGTLYLLNDREVALARAAIPAADAMLIRLDGRNVLAPGWQAPLPQGAVDLRAQPGSLPFGLPFQSDMAPAADARLLLGEGWNSTDAQEVSTRSDKAVLHVPVGDAAGTVQVELRLHRTDVRKSAAQRLDIWSAGQRVGSCSPARDDCRVLRLELPVGRGTGPFRELVLKSDRPDARLRIALDGVRVSPVR